MHIYSINCQFHDVLQVLWRYRLEGGIEGDMLSQPVTTAIQSGPSTQPESTPLLRRIDGTKQAYEQ